MKSYLHYSMLSMSGALGLYQNDNVIESSFLLSRKEYVEEMVRPEVTAKRSGFVAFFRRIFSPKSPKSTSYF